MFIKGFFPGTFPGEEKRKFDALDYADITQEEYKTFDRVWSTFWYYDLSFSGEKYCFNGPNVSVYDYQKYFEVVSKLSTHYVSDILSKGSGNKELAEYLKKRNFHRVEVHKYNNFKNVLRQKFDIKGPIDDLSCPLVYQIGLYSAGECQEPKDKPEKAPRLFFRLTERGTFSLFLLDLYHELCKAPNMSSKRPA